jgi:hypothetical protein
MRVRKLLEILDNKCPACNKELTHQNGNWECRINDHYRYHLTMSHQRGNLNFFSITYKKYRISYYEQSKIIYFYTAETITSSNIFNLKCDNIEQFLIDNKDMETKIEKLLILC